MRAETAAAEPTFAEATLQARTAATDAAREAGVEVVEPHDAESAIAVSDLFAHIWARSDGGAPAPVHLLLALAHTGHYVAAARGDGEIVGAAMGFLSPESPDQPANGGTALLLHSHIAGVQPNWQSRHVGLALKLHQRAWALARGVRRVEWTFDPLVRRNAYFNVAKLGVRLEVYVPNFYGPMADDINAGEDSDRCFARWDVASRRAMDASEGRLEAPDAASLRPPRAVRLLADDGRGGPHVAVVGHLPAGALGLCWVPRDIVALRAKDPGLARAWRHALRETLGAVLADGCAVTAVTRDGWYVVERLPQDEPLHGTAAEPGS